MILTCTNCDTSFNVSTDAIGEHGRFVRCSRCGYEWLATIANEAEEETLSQSVEETPQSPLDSLEEPIDFHNKREFLKIHPPAAPLTSSRGSKSSSIKHFIVHLSIFGLVCSLLFLVATLMIFFRSDITAIAPEMHKAYAIVGLNNLGHIKLDTIRYTVHESHDGTKPELAIDLYIHVINTSQSPQFLENIKITAFDKNMQQVGKIIAKKNKLLPISDAAYIVKARLSHLPPQTKTVSIEVAGKLDGYSSWFGRKRNKVAKEVKLSH